MPLRTVVGGAPLPSFTPTLPRFLYDPLIDEPTGQDFVPSLVYSSNPTNDLTTITTTPTAIASTSNANASLIAETNAETLDLTSVAPSLINVTPIAEQGQVTNTVHSVSYTVITSPSAALVSPEGRRRRASRPHLFTPPFTTLTPVPCRARAPDGFPPSRRPMILDYSPLVLSRLVPSGSHLSPLPTTNLSARAFCKRKRDKQEKAKRTLIDYSDLYGDNTEWDETTRDRSPSTRSASLLPAGIEESVQGELRNWASRELREEGARRVEW
jgi:hypothetical protein